MIYFIVFEEGYYLNNKKTVFFCIAMIISLILVFCVFIYYNQFQPKSFLETFHKDLTSITKIVIRDGNTGDIYSFDNRKTTKEITDVFMKSEYVKARRGDKRVGYSYSIEYYSGNNELVFDSIITNQTIHANNIVYYINPNIDNTIDFISDLITDQVHE